MDSEFELNFLIVKYLRQGGCPEAAELLEATLNKDCNLPSRLDWTGKEHKQTFAQIEKQYPKIRANHLTDLLKRINQRSLFSLAAPPSVESRIFSAKRYLARGQLGLPVVSKQQAFLPVYTKLHLLRRTIGHLSAVFCLVFDKTGQYVFTGADDLLVKMWGTYNGRLYFTFRGASAEISDLAISEDNRLLAAGSTDKIIRVWCLRTASPVAVLSKNTGTITAIHFCPANLTGVPHYLAVTSGDGTVSFWRYSFNKADKSKKPVFDSAPTRYHEKMRPGGAQMICASFSPGGLFLATGSVDHHVRVYMMDGKEGPVKVLEEKAHTERVDSILWSNLPELRFASGSKDGTARIWSFKFGEWHSQQLIGKAEDGRTVCYNTYKQCEENIRVTMTAWSCDDSTLTTALSDATLCVWETKTCKILHRLKGHKDEVYVLEPHPSSHDIMLSGAHDGSIIVWQISTQTILFQYHNDIQGQGHGAIYDAKWCPNELYIAASDSHGHVLFFGCSPNPAYKKCPEEMFFHTDYRPLLRDAAHHVVDEQSQLAPHLLPPPILVDVEGNPYPADIQRLVPGREHLTGQECLAPNILETEISPPRRRSGEHRRASASEGPSTSRNQVTPGRSGDQQPAASNIDQLIAELAANSVVGGEDAGNQSMMSDHSYASPGRRQPSGGNNEQPENAPVPRTQDLTRSVWRKRELVPARLFSNLASSQARRKNLGIRERQSYKMEMAKRRTVRIGLESRHEGIERIMGSRRGRGGRGGARLSRSDRTRTSRQARPVHSNPQPHAQDSHDDNDSTEEEEQEEAVNSDATSDTELEESDLESDESSSSSSTDYSDWGANNLTPPQRTARKSARGTEGSKPASSQEESEAEAENLPSASTAQENGTPGPSRTAKTKKKNYSFNPSRLDDIPPEYLPSDWLAQYIPNKSPYFPQMGDEVMYIKQGHVGYINLVKTRNSYRLNMREQHCLQRDDIKDVELVKVIGMKHEIRPPRLCCLKLAIVDPSDNRLTGENFSIKYHDMNDVVDFLVLRHNYEASLKVKWKAGDRYRCQIEDSWWYGTVLETAPIDPTLSDSNFLSIRCLWDTGDEERLSPWDMDPVSPSQTGYEKTTEAIAVTREEIDRFLYTPTSDEWRGLDSKTECKRISAGLEQVMALAIAEPFNYPVDLTQYPDYMLEIEYPMDFSLIKSRLDNQFYRRITAVQFDVRYMATNAESYNRPKTDIVKNARILTDLVLKIIQDPELTDVNGEYHRLVDNFKWEDTQEAKPGKSTAGTSGGPGRPRRRIKSGGASSESNSPINPKQWKHDCNDLLKRMFAMPDSEPFREPVSEIDFPDYSRFITTPMDLSSIQETLRVGEYKTPMELKEDMNLVFANSFKYNTSRKSPIIAMTKNLKDYFLEEFQIIVKDWRKVNRRLTLLKKKGISPSVTPKKQGRTPQKRKARRDDSDDEDEEFDETEETEEDAYEDPGEGPSSAQKNGRGRRKKPVKYDEDSQSSEESSEETQNIIKPRSAKKKAPKAVAFDEESETEEENKSKGRRKLVLSETDEETPKDKGKGVSTKALSRRQQAAANQRSAELENRQPSVSPRKRGGKGEKRKRRREETEEEDSEDLPISQRRGKRGKSRRRKESFVVDSEEELSEEETEESTPEEDSDEQFSEDFDEEEEYAPRRKSSAKGGKSKQRRRHSSDGGKKQRGEKRKRDIDSLAPRPRRQATARALSRFAKTESDEESMSEEEERTSRRKRSRHDRQGPREEMRPPRGSSSRSAGQSEAAGSSSSLSKAAETVTISAADSSTDPRINERLGTDSDQEPLPPPSTSARRSAGRGSPRKKDSTVRLEDYSNEELLMEASRRGRRKHSSHHEDAGGPNEEMGRGKRAKRPVRYHEESFDFRTDAPGRSGGSRRRSGARPNYLDQSFSNDEQESQSYIPVSRGRRRSRNAAQQAEQDDDFSEQEEEEVDHRRGSRGGGSRRAAPVSNQILEVVPGTGGAGGPEDSGDESDFGRRKRSRRVLTSRSTPGGSSASSSRRPQRQSAAAIVGYRDLDSSDEDLSSRRRRARNNSTRGGYPGGNRNQDDSEMSEDDGQHESGGGGGGVSSRGRVRRINRRLLE